METYSRNDVQHILQHALSMQAEENFSKQQLLEMATEAGISAETLQQAEQEWLSQRDTIRRQDILTARRRQGFKAHLIPYIAVNSFLILLNLFTSPRYLWSMYPLFGWGLGLVLHGASLSKVSPNQLDPESQSFTWTTSSCRKG